MINLKILSFLSLILAAMYLYLNAHSINKEEEKLNSKINEKNDLISLAKSKVGSSYIYAKSGPDSFDCSGFVYYIFKENNINLPRTSLEQSKVANKVSVEELEKGDLVFFDTSLKGQVNHSGIYLGEGKFIHASSGKANGVTISDINGWYKDKFKWGIKKDSLDSY